MAPGELADAGLDTLLDMKQSAGALLYRTRDQKLEVLLVHPSGNYNRHKPWSIPKGLVDPGEDFEQAARRETFEETGVVAPEHLVSLGSVVLAKSRKQVHCFAGLAPPDAEPRCASWEVDCAEFVAIEHTRELLNPDQAPLLDRLAGIVGGERRPRAMGRGTWRPITEPPSLLGARTAGSRHSSVGSRASAKSTTHAWGMYADTIARARFTQRSQ